MSADLTAHFVALDGELLRLVRIDTALFTGEGEDAICQSFPDARAAQSHLEMVLVRHRRQGHRIGTRPLTAAELAALRPDGEALDELIDCLRWDHDQGRVHVHLRSPAHVDRCDEIMIRAAAQHAGLMQVLCDPEIPHRALSSALRRHPLPDLHTFAFDTHFQTVTRQRQNLCGPLDELLSGLPRLERLFATGDLSFDAPCSHDELAELYLLGDPLSPELLTHLGACHFDRLELLGLRLSSDAAAPPADAVAAALHALDAPNVRIVELDGADDLVALLTALSDRPLPLGWETLRVYGPVRDEDTLLELLATRAHIFASLGELCLPLGDLSLPAQTRAMALVPELCDPDDLPERLGPDLYLSE